MSERVRLNSLGKGSKIRFLNHPTGIMLYDINSLYRIMGLDGKLVGVDRHPFGGHHVVVSGSEEVIVVERR